MKRPRLTLTPLLVLAFAALTIGATALAGALSYWDTEARATAAAQVRVDRGNQVLTRLMDERQRRLGDEAEWLALRTAVNDAFNARDIPALNDALVAGRSQFNTPTGNTTSAVAVLDEKGKALAEQPPRAAFDFSVMNPVRSALAAQQPATGTLQRRGVDARPTAAQPLNELGLVAAYPLMRDGK